MPSKKANKCRRTKIPGISDCGVDLSFSDEFNIDVYTEMIRNLLRDSNYCIIDNAGAGDCFFLALQQAASLHTIGNEASKFTNQNLRKNVSSNLSLDSYNFIKRLTENGAFDEEVNARGDNLYKTIKNKSFDDAKKFILSSNYWADELAIEKLSTGKFTINRINKRLRFILYNTNRNDFYIPKLFLIDADDIARTRTEFENLDQFQQNDDWINKQKEDFHYIILINEDAYHYAMIAKTNGALKGVFSFDELPQHLKNLVDGEIRRNENNVSRASRRQSPISARDKMKGKIKDVKNRNKFNKGDTVLYEKNNLKAKIEHVDYTDPDEISYTISVGKREINTLEKNLRALESKSQTTKDKKASKSKSGPVSKSKSGPASKSKSSGPVSKSKSGTVLKSKSGPASKSKSKERVYTKEEYIDNIVMGHLNTAEQKRNFKKILKTNKLAQKGIDINYKKYLDEQKKKK